MTAEAFPSIFAGFSLGIAIAGAPGPVQAVLLTESVRGGMWRGLRALAGASTTFGLLLVLLAFGVSLAPQDGLVLRLVRIGGGAFLIWLAADGLRSDSGSPPDRTRKGSLPPAVRGSVAIILNPGAWLFVGVVASPLLATAADVGGPGAAFVTAAALLLGAGLGDLGVVILGASGLRRTKHPAGNAIRRGLAIVLAGLGIMVLAGGLVG